MLSFSKKRIFTMVLFFPMFSGAMESSDSMHIGTSNVNVETKKTFKKLEFYNGYLSKFIKPVRAIAFNENSLLYGTKDGTINAVNMHNWDNFELYKFPCKNDYDINEIAFNKNLVACSIGYAIHLVDLKSKSEAKLEVLHSSVSKENLNFFSDNKIISSSGGCISLWDLTTQKEILCFPHQKSPNGPAEIRALTSNVLMGLIASGTIDKDIQLWDIRSRKLVNDLQNEAAVTTLNFKPANCRLLFSGSDAVKKTVKVWDIIAGKYNLSFNDKALKNWYGIDQLKFNYDASIFATAGYNRNMKLWNSETDECPYFMPDVRNYEIAFHPDQNIIAFGSKEEPGNIAMYHFKKLPGRI